MANKYYYLYLQTFLSLIPLMTASTPPTNNNITSILQKADEFTKFVSLLRSSQVADRLETQLESLSSSGLTIFAPNNNAFSGLIPGALNSLGYDQMAKLVLFHCVPSFLSFSDLHSAINPIRTEAGDVGPGQYPLNVSAVGTQVKFYTGVDRDLVSVSSTIYSNSTYRLAIYEVDKLLAPMAVFPISPFQHPALAPGLGSSTSSMSNSGDDQQGVAPVVAGGSRDNYGGEGSRSARTTASISGRLGYFQFYYYIVFGVGILLSSL